MNNFLTKDSIKKNSPEGVWLLNRLAIRKLSSKVLNIKIKIIKYTNFFTGM